MSKSCIKLKLGDKVYTYKRPGHGGVRGERGGVLSNMAGRLGIPLDPDPQVDRLADFVIQFGRQIRRDKKTGTYFVVMHCQDGNISKVNPFEPGQGFTMPAEHLGR